MARAKSTKLLAGMPDRYSDNWLSRLDRRTKVARAIMRRIGNLESDAGGAESLSHAKTSLIKRAAFLELILESYELRFANGELVDIGGLTQTLNSLLGLYRLLGVERVARQVPTLQAYLAGKGRS